MSLLLAGYFRKIIFIVTDNGRHPPRFRDVLAVIVSFSSLSNIKRLL
jgi:hypothetical protein